jgi:hypothetical protein
MKLYYAKANVSEKETTLVSTYFSWLSIFFGSRGTFQKLNQPVQTWS